MIVMNPADLRFPEPVRELWAALWDQVAESHVKWFMWRQLFGTSQERVDVLNASASAFFRVLLVMMSHDAQLALCRLADPARTGKHTNLSLAALMEGLVKCGESTLVTKLGPLVEGYKVACQPVEHRRDKRYAHLGRQTILNARVTPLQNTPRKELEDAFKALRAVMNCIEAHFTDATTDYTDATLEGDGESLIAVLRNGLRYHQLVKEGVIPLEDLIKTARGQHS